MKLNWGHKLVVFMIIFMLFITILVVVMSRQHVSLVETNYYERGMNYENELRKHEKTKGLIHTLEYNAAKAQIVFTSAIGGNISGTAKFYRPNDSDQDFDKPFTLNEYGACTLSTVGMQRGIWRLTMEWQLHTDTMATTKDFYIQ
ncbi:MAG: FixH family protein [Bacteroidota bacterium]|jgi:hypothetical protein